MPSLTIHVTMPVAEASVFPRWSSRRSGATSPQVVPCPPSAVAKAVTPMPLDILDLVSCGTADISRLFGPEPTVALVGSGVSIWSPTDLPSGQQFTSGVYDALFKSAAPALEAADEDWLRQWFVSGDVRLDLSPLPFEVLLERSPNPEAVGRLIGELYSSSTANPVHTALAKLVTNGTVHSIVTTNYDLALDSAIGTLLAKVVREGDSSPSLSRAYFKIHGTAGSSDIDTLVFRLSSEGMLPQWKRELLCKLVQGRVLLILGYSGVDFDICPELVRCDPKAVVWNFYSRNDIERSPGLRRMRDAGVRTTVLVGDMKCLLGQLGAGASASLSRRAFDIATELRKILDMDALLLWRSQVLNSMGFARLAIEAAAAVGSSGSWAFGAARSHAQGLFHAGKYRASSNAFHKASNAASDDHSRRLCILDAADAARCNGRLHAARALVEKAVKGLDAHSTSGRTILGRADLKLVLIEREAFFMSGKRLIPGSQRELTNRLRPLVVRCARAAIEDGRWFDFQQAALWAGRLGIAISDLESAQAFAPPPVNAGYKHLSYPVAVAMDLTDKVSRGSITYDVLEPFLELMQLFGCHPQIWKVARVLLARGHGRLLSRRGRIMLRSFLACEYTPCMRAAWILRGA